MYIDIYIYKYIHIYIHIHIHIYTYIHIFIYIHTHTYIHIYVYIHIYIYIGAADLLKDRGVKSLGNFLISYKDEKKNVMDIINTIKKLDPDIVLWYICIYIYIYIYI
jgi:hypothetical protein